MPLILSFPRKRESKNLSRLSPVPCKGQAWAPAFAGTTSWRADCIPSHALSTRPSFARSISFLFGHAWPIFPRSVFDPPQRRLEVGDEGDIRPGDRAPARDKHIIGSRRCLARQDRRRGAAQPALRTVAGYRITDLSACSETDANRQDAPRSFRPPRGLQDQTGRNRPAAGGGDTQEIGAGAERYKPAVRRIPRRLGWVGRD